jgi:hypothetical protein
MASTTWGAPMLAGDWKSSLLASMVSAIRRCGTGGRWRPTTAGRLGIASYTPGVKLRMSLAPAPGWPPRTFHRRHERCAAAKL